MTRNATLADIPSVLALWETAPKVTALVGRGDERAEGLWRALGYRDDVEIGRWVRSIT